MTRKKVANIAGYTAAAVTGVAGLALGYLYLRRPATAEPLPIKVPITAERIARGRRIYLLADCDGCHSPRDFTRFAGPALPGMTASGQQFPDSMGLPGRVVAPNITPDRETGIGAWTDGEKIRAIREGIGRDGRALFPFMGYPRYATMSDEDVQSLVAYLNSLPPVRRALPRTRLNFPVNLLIKSAPKPVGRVPKPDRADRVRYGEYLVNLGGCAECHTKEQRAAYAGGAEFNFPMARVVSANISPDRDTGIGRWTESYFVERFYVYKEYAEKASPKVGPNAFTLMPWLSLAQLPPDDLRAMYAFLKRQPAIHNAVVIHPANSATQTTAAIE